MKMASYKRGYKNDKLSGSSHNWPSWRSIFYYLVEENKRPIIYRILKNGMKECFLIFRAWFKAEITLSRPTGRLCRVSSTWVAQSLVQLGACPSGRGQVEWQLPRTLWTGISPTWLSLEVTDLSQEQTASDRLNTWTWAENPITRIQIITFLIKQEWPDLLQELLDSEKITEEQFQNNSHLNIVGMVGSIDNGKESGLFEVLKI